MYQHSLIKGFYREGVFERRINSRRKSWKKQRGGPSYIPSHTFSTALIDILKPKEAPVPKPDTPDADALPLSQLAAQWARRRLTADAPRDELAELRASIEQLPASFRARDALLALIDEAQGNLDTFKSKVETWFDDAMERVTGWYKRKIQLINLIVAVIITLAFNVDTLLIANTLYRTPTVRQAIVAAAEKSVTVPTPEATEEDGGATTAITATQTLSPTLSPIAQIDQYAGELQSLALPIGWPTPVELTKQQKIARPLGWAITVCAICTGAPFWFDVMSKLINLRSSGPPASSEEETESQRGSRSR
jgi:hypothetical protein